MDNPLDQEETPNHIHRFEVKGSGLSCWGECECREKLAGDNGPIVGSRSKIESAIGHQEPTEADPPSS